MILESEEEIKSSARLSHVLKDPQIELDANGTSDENGNLHDVNCNEKQTMGDFSASSDEDGIPDDEIAVSRWIASYF